MSLRFITHPVRGCLREKKNIYRKAIYQSRYWRWVPPLWGEWRPQNSLKKKSWQILRHINMICSDVLTAYIKRNENHVRSRLQTYILYNHICSNMDHKALSKSRGLISFDILWFRKRSTSQIQRTTADIILIGT